MCQRPKRFAVYIAISLLTSSAISAEPELKPGVRLALGGRLQGSAAPEVVDWDNDQHAKHRRMMRIRLPKNSFTALPQRALGFFAKQFTWVCWMKLQPRMFW